ncbi:hypothetical protein FB45DRAFT_1084359 [Roridomyces roridus]|uniref:F-box domain-containing protein n=1 Tax=Roridomyces roridus TaxID=1738132 RepID=A0AAD7FIF8_9AGAR|nr:hypothetical protein FB45DRAFT_1084359 [Roridomyces roridus]
MVLTRRQRTALSSAMHLPNELLIEVIHNVEEADFPSLCSVSKLLHSLTLPFLNRAVVLVLYRARFVAFCSGLVSSPTRGSAIRSLTIRETLFDKTISKRDLDLLVEAMKLMSCLEKLHISGAALCPTLSLLTFPRLVICDLHILSSCAEVVQFLTRHTTITHLTARLGSASYHIPAITLPNLVHLEAPSHVLKCIVSPKLPAMRLIWLDTGTSYDSIDQTVSAFKALTSSDAPFVSYQDLVDSWFFGFVLQSLSQHMQHTTSLCIRVRRIDDVHNACRTLPRFSRLQYLALECHYDMSVVHTNFQLQKLEAWKFVRSKVDAGVIGSLRACRIGNNHTAWKKEDGLWMEYPEEEFQIQAGFAAFTRDSL